MGDSAFNLTPEQYAAQYAATVAAPEDTSAAAVKDQEPVLADVAPQFADATSDAPEGVDGDSLPEFKDLRRMLPAQRIKAQADMGKLALTLPDKFRQLADDGEVSMELDLSNLAPEDLDSVANLVAQAQEIVLGGAKDRQAMEEWLLDQTSPVEAVMYAFSRYQERLGN